MNEKKFLAAHIPVPVTRMVEDIVGCKWSPPFGRKFASILDGVEALQRDLDTPNAYRGGGGS